MTRTISGRFIAFVAMAMLGAAPAYAAGDLLVAPTRLVFGENGGGEVLLSNKGAESATYRVSVVLKKMREDGQSDEIAQPTPEQQQLVDMVSFAPRRVVLAPGQTQTVRVAVHVPPAWPVGEYRVHMLFRAVPAEGQALLAAAQEGVSIALTPVYGVTIPLIARKGSLDAQVAIQNVRPVHAGGKEQLMLDLTRSGTRSVYGTVRLFKPGAAQPLAELKGVAVYQEIGKRSVTLPLPDAGKLSGPVIVRFAEEGSNADKAMAEAALTL